MTLDSAVRFTDCLYSRSITDESVGYYHSSALPTFQKKRCHFNPKHDDNQADEVLREWRENAFYWQKHRDPIRTMFAPITQALIDDAGIVQGQSVLDVAGGSGEPSLTIAERVGPKGSVLCSDVVAEMVSGAQSEAQRVGLTNIEFRQCAADFY